MVADFRDEKKDEIPINFESYKLVTKVREIFDWLNREGIKDFEVLSASKSQ